MSKTLAAQIDALTAVGIEDHVSAEAIARKLGCSPRTVRDEMTAGRLAYVRIGRLRFVPVSAAAAYIAARAIGNHPARKPTPVTPIFDRPRRAATH